MANYLQRIVASGARTISPARPPVTAYALIPPVAAPVFPSAPEVGMHVDEFSEPILSKHEEPLRAGDQRHGVREHDAMPSAASPTPKQVIENSPSVPPGVPAVWPLTPILSSPSERVRAPEGLRRARSNVTPPQEAIREVVKVPLKQQAQSVSESPEALPRPMHSESAPVPVEIRERAPSQPIPDRVPPLAVKMPIQQVELPVANMNATSEKKPIPALTSVKPERAEAANADRKVEIPTPPSTPKLPIETHPVEVRASAPRQTISPPVSNIADKRRQNKISIGRIDVQVNNQIPPQPVNPQSAKAPASSNFLDTRYLSRFFLRL